MIQRFLENFNKLPLSNRSMVYLKWIYAVWNIIGGLFINIYVFQINGSIQESLIFNIIYFCSTAIWFSGVGYLMSVLGKNVKNMYYWCYLLFAVSFMLLFIFNGSIIATYIFSIIYAFWNGMFWCALHTQELKNITDERRDFYSSSISAGKDIISIFVPFFVAVAFWLWSKFWFDGYLLLFWMLPFCYLVSLLFINNIEDYIPQKITAPDLSNFFNLKKHKFGHLYFFFDGMSHALINLLALVNIILLKTEFNIWIFQSVLALMSALLIVHIWFKRNASNRLKYFIIMGVLYSFIALFLGFYFTVIWFVIFSIAMIFIKPLYEVSLHVYNLKLMDSVKQWKSDFYPAMILREIFLWIWRITVLVSLLLMYIYFNISAETFLRIMLVLLAVNFYFIIFSLYCWEKYERIDK